MTEKEYEKGYLKRYTEVMNKTHPEIWSQLSSLLVDARKNATSFEFAWLGHSIVTFGEYWLQEAKEREIYLEKERKRSQYRRDLAKSVQAEPKISNPTKDRILDGALNLL